MVFEGPSSVSWGGRDNRRWYFSLSPSNLRSGNQLFCMTLTVNDQSDGLHRFVCGVGDGVVDLQYHTQSCRLKFIVEDQLDINARMWVEAAFLCNLTDGFKVVSSEEHVAYHSVYKIPQTSNRGGLVIVAVVITGFRVSSLLWVLRDLTESHLSAGITGRWILRGRARCNREPSKLYLSEVW